jgi:hypothetical protein
MKGLLAVILNMGIIQLQDLKDYWSTHHTTNLSFFRSVFSRDHFSRVLEPYMLVTQTALPRKGRSSPS